MDLIIPGCKQNAVGYRAFSFVVILIVMVAMVVFGNGCNGENGVNGINGTNGTNGVNGTNGTNGTGGASSEVIVPDNYSGVQEAIDSLPNAGGSVFVRAGTYVLTQGLHINNSNVTLSGEQGTILKLGDNVNQPVLLIGSDVETPTTMIENISISNVEIDGNMANQTSETDPNKSWIRNNGIDVRMVSDLWISDVFIHGARSGGVVVSWNSSRIYIADSTFTDNYFDGIALYTSDKIQISSFMTYSNGAAGISLDNGLSDVLFTDGQVMSNASVGIFVRHSSDLLFSNLVISGNLEDGCFMSHQTDGSGAAISGTGVNRLFFSGCSFLDNQRNGIWLASTAGLSDNNAVEGSLFSGNTGSAILVEAGGILDQSGNIMQ